MLDGRPGDRCFVSPGGPHQGTTGAPSGTHGGPIREPRRPHQGTTGASSGNHGGLIREPRGPHQGTTGAPSGNHGGGRDNLPAPWANFLCSFRILGGHFSILNSKRNI